MDYIKCPCGNDEFISVVSIPKIKPPIKLVEKKVICNKCKKQYAAEKVNEILRKV